jgi:uncharacterized protein (TIGR03435 family)
MARFNLITAGLALAVTGLCAQPGPAFEVASVKLSPPYQPSRATGVRLDAARFTATGIPLRNLIYSAYSVPSWRLSGGPAWLDEAYDITATLPPNTSPAMINAMVQSLFADRFHLVVHRETKEFPVLALTVDKRGSKLAASQQGCKFSLKTGKGHLELHCASIPWLLVFRISQTCHR